MITSSNELNQHVETVHEGKNQFKCDICDANFGWKSHNHCLYTLKPSREEKYTLNHHLEQS